MSSSLVVKVTHALDNPERAHIACNVASVALAAGVEVRVFLAVEGVNLALPGVAERLQLEEAPPITELLDALYTSATVTVCTPCATRRGLTADDFRPGTEMAGSARFVELATADGATALVY
ncbi:MAG: sulfur reduction protein DsrE [Nitriliruptorales bacterium]|nr:sulfur reduction protein DsrE [Nitriliruptorales bacterium]